LDYIAAGRTMLRLCYDAESGRQGDHVARDSKQAPTQVDTDQDRYPAVKDALRRLINEVDFETETVEALHVYCQASGEVSVRYLPPRAEEPLIGYLPPPQSS
jgi:hypothetical protein